jgi:hypothetical protein
VGYNIFSDLYVFLIFSALKMRCCADLIILFLLKGPKHEIFEFGFFTQIGPVRVGELGTGEKK